MPKKKKSKMVQIMDIEKSDGTKVMINTPSFKIRGDRVMIFVDDAETISAGGIIIPETAKEKPRRGTLIQVGPGEVDQDGFNNCADLESGMKVWFGKYAGTEFDWEGNEFMIMRENDILGVE